MLFDAVVTPVVVTAMARRRKLASGMSEFDKLCHPEKFATAATAAAAVAAAAVSASGISRAPNQNKLRIILQKSLGLVL